MRNPYVIFTIYQNYTMSWLYKSPSGPLCTDYQANFQFVLDTSTSCHDLNPFQNYVNTCQLYHFKKFVNKYLQAIRTKLMI